MENEKRIELTPKIWNQEQLNLIRLGLEDTEKMLNNAGTSNGLLDSGDLISVISIMNENLIGLHKVLENLIK